MQTLLNLTQKAAVLEAEKQALIGQLLVGAGLPRNSQIRDKRTLFHFVAAASGERAAIPSAAILMRLLTPPPLASPPFGSATPRSWRRQRRAPHAAAPAVAWSRCGRAWQGRCLPGRYGWQPCQALLSASAQRALAPHPNPFVRPIGVQDANDEVFSLNEKLAAAEAELAAARAGQEELQSQVEQLEAASTARQRRIAALEVSSRCFTAASLHRQGGVHARVCCQAAWC